jgi:class 3 adenylate cyclase
VTDALESKEVARLERRVRRLEQTLGQVELIRDTNARLLDRLMSDLAAERARSRDLLFNVLPGPIVDRLEAGEGLIADRHEAVTVLLSDFVGFTEIAGRLAPAELVRQLNELYSAFDASCETHGVEKIETIGDAYMAAAGLDPDPPEPSVAVARVALDMLETVLRTNGAWHIRIGIHAGPAVAGVIGTRKLAYHLWGDTVNVASRLETTSVPDHIQVSSAVADAIRDHLVLDYRGETALKGKGEMPTWFVVGPRDPSGWPSDRRAIHS